MKLEGYRKPTLDLPRHNFIHGVTCVASLKQIVFEGWLYTRIACPPH